MIFGSFGRGPRGRSRTRETGGPAGRVILVLFWEIFYARRVGGGWCNFFLLLGD